MPGLIDKLKSQLGRRKKTEEADELFEGSPGKVDTRARIAKVLAMSVWDLVSTYYSQHGDQAMEIRGPEPQNFAVARDITRPVSVGERMKYLGYRIRVNSIAQDGLARGEYTDVRKAVSQIERTREFETMTRVAG